LQCVAVCCSVLQCVAVCCSVLQCVAVCCSVLQCVAVCGPNVVCAVDAIYHMSHHSLLQCVAVCCSVCPFAARALDAIYDIACVCDIEYVHGIKRVTYAHVCN